MKNAFIFHGTEGYPEENWFPWMKSKLEKLGYEVHIPQFPTPENQSPETWFQVLSEYNVNEESVIFGHSLGGAFLLRLLEQRKIAAAFFIAAPIGILPIRNIETDKPFLESKFDWDTIRSNASNFAVFHSDQDPFMTTRNGKELARQLEVKFNCIENGGHLNAAAGFTEFPLLLETFKKFL